MSKKRPEDVTPDDTVADVPPAKPEPASVTLIDALHQPGQPPRFKSGTRVRATIIGRDLKTNEVGVVIHRAAKLPADCAVTVGEYVEGDHGKYTATMASDQAAENE